MKKKQMVRTRVPDTVVRDLEEIEQIEQADRSTTVRKLLSRRYRTGSWTFIRVCTAAASSRCCPRGRSLSLGNDDYMKTKKITAQYDLEDFQRDLKTVFGESGACQRP